MVLSPRPPIPPFRLSGGAYAEAVRERATELEEQVRRKSCALRAAGQRRGKDLREAARETSTASGRAAHAQDALDAAQKENASLVVRVDDAEERASFVWGHLPDQMDTSRSIVSPALFHPRFM